MPTITPIYSGFVNGDTPLSLTAQPMCSTTATSSSPPSPPTYPSSCSGAADPDYTIGYAPGAVTVTDAPIDVAVSGSQSYGSTSPDFSGTAIPPAGITVNTSGLSCTEVDTSTPIGPGLPAGSHTVVASSCAGTTLTGTGATYYTLTYTERDGGLHGHAGPADHHRLEPDDHRREHADDHAQLLGIQER